ncbi:STAS-like domain-containing protein [Tolumonas auensis]|uniref:STAS-like domain-containing protein n=1 Tax=Tolumonas auensis TaxID=43948 RepID=UPI002AA88269|nr:DUF4325 domain-containing protein [Tolumonas auensis]
MKKIHICNDFSSVPSGRFYTDGKASGEQFREELLKPAIASLKSNEKIMIILDEGVEGYGSSFLVEGFAGMVKYGYINSPELLDKLELKFTDNDFSFYKKKIIEYIESAKYNSEEYISTKK